MPTQSASLGHSPSNGIASSADSAGTKAPKAAPPEAPPSASGTFNPLGIGIPLVLMGGVLVFLFPLVGLLMFAAAAVMIVWGVGATLLARN